MGHAKEIITLDVYADNAQMIADGVKDIQSFIDDVIPDEEELYKEHTYVTIDLDFLAEEDHDIEFAVMEIGVNSEAGMCENVS